MLVPQYETWVAVTGNTLVGLLVLQGHEPKQLYLEPRWRGRVHYDESCLPDPVTPYGAAKAAAETGVLAVHPKAAVVRTSLIIGHGRSVHERPVHQLAAGALDGTLFTDDIRCPVHISDLAAALLELALSGAAGIHHAAGGDALNRLPRGDRRRRRTTAWEQSADLR